MNIQERFTKEELNDMLTYLDELRKSAVTNMFGAAPLLQFRFGIRNREAEEVLKLWMRTFSERHGNG